MGVSKKPEDRQTSRTTVLTTATEKKDYFDYCQSIGEEPTGRLREFMRADMAEFVKLKKR